MKDLRKTYIGEDIQRRDRLLRERVHDPYKTRLKLPEPTLCPQCGAVWHKGRWSWGRECREGANEELCQACHRVNDKYPAGELRLSGNFLAEHKDEIISLVRNTEKAENADHPLHRIMAIEEDDDGVLITTTDIHLPTRIGKAIFRAFEGEFDFHYEEGAYFLRGKWHRDS